MVKIIKVSLYGNSLFIAGLDASLSATPGLEIQRVEAEAGNDLERMLADKPDVIIVDLGVAFKNMTITLLQKFPGVTLIGLDAESDRLLVLSVRQQRALAAADLVRVIQSPYTPGKE